VFRPYHNEHDIPAQGNLSGAVEDGCLDDIKPVFGFLADFGEFLFCHTGIMLVRKLLYRMAPRKIPGRSEENRDPADPGGGRLDPRNLILYREVLPLNTCPRLHLAAPAGKRRHQCDLISIPGVGVPVDEDAVPSTPLVLVTGSDMDVGKTTCAASLAHGLDPVNAVSESLQYTWGTLKHGFRPGMGQQLPNRLYWARETDESDEKKEG